MYKVQTEGHIAQDILIQLCIIDFENCKIYNSDSIPHHCLLVICKLLSHQEERKVFILLVVEKLDRVRIKQEC